jgi:hypothetical protein
MRNAAGLFQQSCSDRAVSTKNTGFLYSVIIRHRWQKPSICVAAHKGSGRQSTSGGATRKHGGPRPTNRAAHCKRQCRQN